MSDITRINRNRRKADRKLISEGKRPARIIPLGPLRQVRFEGELKRIFGGVMDMEPTEAAHVICDLVPKLISRYATRKIVERFSMTVGFNADTETLVAKYFLDKKEVHPNRLYQMLNPGTKRAIAWTFDKDGNQVAITSQADLDRLAEERAKLGPITIGGPRKN